MIIGNGFLANHFSFYKNSNDVLIFASGVSNSNENQPANFERERNLLLKTIEKNIKKLIVYFSSCDVIYANILDKPYFFHKIEMEQLIINYSKEYLIFRIPQIIGYSRNKNTLINIIIDSIINNKKIEVWSRSYKNLIEINDIFFIANDLISNYLCKNKIINVINKYYYSINEIINVMEKIINKNAIKDLVEKGFYPNYERSPLLEKYDNIFSYEKYLTKNLYNHYIDFIKDNEYSLLQN
ncbi:MAG: NAD(P)-dependent oxidoreductase [Spirochaetes bacterium]|nr:NAD(P)-dependent oxidoreductase [Spirochaetota bacterium]